MSFITCSKRRSSLAARRTGGKYRAASKCSRHVACSDHDNKETPNESSRQVLRDQRILSGSCIGGERTTAHHANRRSFLSRPFHFATASGGVSAPHSGTTQQPRPARRTGTADSAARHVTHPHRWRDAAFSYCGGG